MSEQKFKINELITDIKKNLCRKKKKFSIKRSIPSHNCPWDHPPLYTLCVFLVGRTKLQSLLMTW